MARPKKSIEARKTRKLCYRLSEAEYLKLSHKAASMGVSVNELARRLALDGSDALNVTVNERIDPALIQQFHHIGVNLNQAVKRFHMTGRSPKYLDAMCERIDALIDEAQSQEKI